MGDVEMNVQDVFYCITRAEDREDWSVRWVGESSEPALQDQEEVWLKQVFGELSFTMQHKIITSLHQEGENVNELMTYYAMTTVLPNAIAPVMIFSMIALALYSLFG